ncbi:MAG: alkaline phosphatase, partial [Thermoflexibacteraceae bacterium]
VETAEKKGLATGMVATSSVTHATPASFIAHQKHRKMQEEIAADLLNVDVDVVIGGGKQFFTKRKDKKDLLTQLQAKNYTLLDNIQAVSSTDKNKVVALLAEDGMPKYSEGRGDMLSISTRKALEILKKNGGDKGFFLMVEGSQIDWGGHDNNLQYVVDELLDFDKTIGEVLEFAAKDGETLVIITADHETGGLSLVGGDIQQGQVEGKFSTDYHTAVMVPVFAFGAGAMEFAGIYENIAIYHKMMQLLQLKK